MQGRTVNAADAGKYTAMSARQFGHLPGLKSAKKFMNGCGDRGEAS